MVNLLDAAIPVLILLGANVSIQRFEALSSESLKRDHTKWPEALHTAQSSDIPAYRIRAETHVGNIVNAMHLECAPWSPPPHCGGKTHSGGARLWFLPGCAVSPGFKSCESMRESVTFQVDTLRGVERKLSGSEGFASLLFLRTLAKSVHGAACAALGRESDAFELHLLHSDVSPTPDLVPKREQIMDVIACSVAPFLWAYRLVEIAPWIAYDFNALPEGEGTETLADRSALTMACVGTVFAAFTAALIVRVSLSDGCRWYFPMCLSVVVLASPSAAATAALCLCLVRSVLFHRLDPATLRSTKAASVIS
eukprot:TRINITY_DN19274_c0_g1_i2.p1 TRINITY_DN19274_c0_g1~~TRINITY_DN19274_c0_g1_i2.p1  ORF type:complete len:310 (+),score=33.77 TRINITY_DN19274_c0_g1_i2:66-995(+)